MNIQLVKIVSGAKTLYVNIVYYASMERAYVDSFYKWASKVKKLLYENGLGDVWENQGAYDPDASMSVFWAVGWHLQTKLERQINGVTES